MLKVADKEKSYYEGKEFKTLCCSCEEVSAEKEIVVKGDKYAGVNMTLPFCNKCLENMLS
ncbi:hypothetical protein ABE236_18155 [Priestia endophytica]|uniref:hypothetical protein n=1 Tax=Priestia endophytica TaxID=135735 RepID=UPI003D28269E